jgi:hypothetical protein
VAKYYVALALSAERELKKLPAQLVTRIVGRLEKLTLADFERERAALKRLGL